MSKMDEMREKILAILDDCVAIGRALPYGTDMHYAKKEASVNEILSLTLNDYTLEQLIELAARVDKDSRLAVVIENGELPKNPYHQRMKSILLTGEEIQDAVVTAMYKDGELFPPLKNDYAVSAEDRAIAQAQLRQVVKWGEDIDLEHHRIRRFDCPECMQQLRREAGMEG